MRIVYESLFKRGLGGGSGRVAHELSRQVARQEDVVLVCPADQVGLHVDEDGTRVYGIRSAGDGDFQMPELTASAVGALFDFLDAFDPDIVHAHDPALIGLICQVWARTRRVPFVFTSHIIPQRALEFGTADALETSLTGTAFGESFTRYLLLDFIADCDGVVALNDVVARSLRRFGYEGTLFTIPNGRDLAVYNACAFPSLDGPERILTFVGYLSERKNQAYLVEMLRYLPPEYRLRLVGSELTQSYADSLRRRAHMLGLEDRVDFVGKIPYQEVPQALEEAHLFVSASRMEVQSLVIIEALASGTPVVGLANETVDELVDEAVGRRLPQDASPQAFAQAVMELAQDVDGYEERCRAARRRVQDMDWQQVVSDTLDAYRALISVAPSPLEDGSVGELLSLLPEGEVRRALRRKIIESQRTGGPSIRRLLGMTLPRGILSWIRVPSRTWMWAGLTIAVSAITFLLKKHRGGGPHS